MFTCPYCGSKYPDRLVEKVANERRKEIVCPRCNNHSEVSFQSNRNTHEDDEYEYINIAEFLMPYLKVAIPIVFIIAIASFLLFAGNVPQEKTQSSLFEMEEFFGWWENKESMEVLNFLSNTNVTSVGSNPEEPTYTLVKKSCQNGIRAGVTNISGTQYVTYQTTDAGLFFVDANTFFTEGIINASLTENDVSDYSVNWKYAYTNVTKWFSIYDDYQKSGKTEYDGTFGYPKIIRP
jgi:hypothetical protein